MPRHFGIPSAVKHAVIAESIAVAVAAVGLLVWISVFTTIVQW